MNDVKLKKTINSISPINKSLKDDIQNHLNNLTKPRRSLGRLEEFVEKVCMITGNLEPEIGKKIIFTFAADHGVAEENVSAFPKEVTQQMVKNMISGGAAVNVLARHAGIENRIIDIGVLPPFKKTKGLICRNVKQGSDNIAKGPAMSVDKAEAAIVVGIELAEKAVKEDVKLIGTGEMGIANTTPSSAVFAAVLGCDVEEITGCGTGIDNNTLKKKIKIIKQALKINKKFLTLPLNILAAVGGLEIAGICGLILGATANKIPVVVDGFISSAGALIACELNSNVKDYLHRKQVTKLFLISIT